MGASAVDRAAARSALTVEPLLLWGLGLLLASLLVLAIEVFVPSMGLLAVLAGAMALGGLACLFGHSLSWGITGTLTVLILGPVVAAAGFRIMPSTPFGRRMLFGDAGEERPVLPDAVTSEFAGLLGVVGEAMTDLRPVGVVSVEGQRVEALSETVFVRAGARVRVTSVEGTQIKVRAVD